MCLGTYDASLLQQAEAKFLDGLRGENRFLELSRNQAWNLEQIFTRADTLNWAMPSKNSDINDI